jgi:hypothetical protein
MDKEWNDEYWPEAADRLYVMSCNIEEYLSRHPAIIKAGVSPDIEKAIEHLQNAYQVIGGMIDD